MSQGSSTLESPLQTLPAPVTANVARWNGRATVERSAVPSLIAFTTGLVAVSSNQPRAALFFIGACTVTIGLYFVVPPNDDEKAHPIISIFLQRLPDILTAIGCILIVFGIGIAFPNEIALIPLLLFVSFAAFAAFLGVTLGVRTTASLYGAALVSLVTFVVLAYLA